MNLELTLFVDESGSLAEDTKYFVVGGILFQGSSIEVNPKLNQVAKNLLVKLISRNRRYKNSLAKINEIKASELATPDKEFAISFLMENVDFNVIYVYISKDEKFKEWLKRKINKRKTILYLYKSLISIAVEFDLHVSKVYIDKSHYVRGVEKKITKTFQKSPEILFEDSWKLGGLQFADLIANALFISLEPSKRISSPYNLLRNKILIQRLIPWKALKKFKL